MYLYICYYSKCLRSFRVLPSSWARLEAVKLWLSAQIHLLSSFVNKILLEHRQAPLFNCIYLFWWLLSLYHGRLEYLQWIPYNSQSQKYFLSDPLKKMFVNLWTRLMLKTNSSSFCSINQRPEILCIDLSSSYITVTTTRACLRKENIWWNEHKRKCIMHSGF